MNGWLLDTNVVSQLAPSKDGHTRVTPHLSAWLRSNSDRLFLSAVSVAEITAGIENLRRSGSRRRVGELQTWIDRILDRYEERTLSVDIAVARAAGAIADHARSIGRDPGFADILIAATAEANALVLVTRNIRHFEMLGLSVSVLDPQDPESLS